MTAVVFCSAFSDSLKGLNTALFLILLFGGRVSHLPAIHFCFMQQHLFTFSWHIKHSKSSLSCVINVYHILSCFHTDKLDKEILAGQQINQTHKISSNFCRWIVFCFSFKGQLRHKENEKISFPSRNNSSYLTSNKKQNSVCWLFLNPSTQKTNYLALLLWWRA